MFATDLLFRVAVVAVVGLCVAAAIGFIRWRSGREPLAWVPADLGPFPAALYFGDATCVSCQPASAAIVAGDLEVRTYEWASHGDVFDVMEIAEVPRLVAVGRGGRVLADISGVPTARQIAKVKLQLSRE